MVHNIKTLKKKLLDKIKRNHNSYIIFLDSVDNFLSFILFFHARFLMTHHYMLYVGLYSEGLFIKLSFFFSYYYSPNVFLDETNSRRIYDSSFRSPAAKGFRAAGLPETKRNMLVLLPTTFLEYKTRAP